MGEFNPDFDFDRLQEDLKRKEEAFKNKKEETKAPEEEETNSLLRIRTAKQTLLEAANQADPIELYPGLVIEHEITILFADTGIGKTIYGVQIAIYISKTRKVLYIDLELSDKQFEKRYKDEQGNHYAFNDNFFRVDYSPNMEIPPGMKYEAYFIYSLKKAIQETGAKIIIIDNMTKLAAGETDSAKATIPIMESLSKLKREHGLTFLLLEHNKKVGGFRPISLNDLQGSKMKSNFADAVFTMGRSEKDSNLRYIKQLKVRSAECVYGPDNILLLEKRKEEGFLHFALIGTGKEWEHTKEPSDKDREAQKAQIIELKQKGYSLRRIGEELNISHTQVKRIWEDCNAL